ncbi:uncharacterized protein CANTADRAFT_190059 [Suhomyces tanzawaensis NRRL Y-17324]|uniref:Uncharacterized protein n=1 Tax=Suhomyces tanzawaensis NRRL Y-17324 TaxID=984487 RepID=A0A1E4SNH1_9ASCO|nr:uncharacterized protein CANTADRAFT_190059 [Suhomyces tanzawaensis NRRL Y-17324]ODV81071.1 hypothetical protein CANTADRAFT_190059 [Suhomyces tanzawaensis NRRL Y-17324]
MPADINLMGVPFPFRPRNRYFGHLQASPVSLRTGFLISPHRTVATVSHAILRLSRRPPRSSFSPHVCIPPPFLLPTPWPRLAVPAFSHLLALA